MNRATFFTALLFTLALGQALGSKWNQYRGPNGSGLAKGSQPPIKPSGDNLAWQTEISPGFSAPVLSAKRIFLTGLAKGRLVTLALDKASGKLLWQKKAPKVELEKVHKASHPAASSALVSGDDDGGAESYVDGNETWVERMFDLIFVERFLYPPNLDHGPSCTPQEDPSVVTAFPELANSGVAPVCPNGYFD